MEVVKYSEWNRTSNNNYTTEKMNQDSPKRTANTTGASLQISQQALALMQKQDLKKSNVPVEGGPVVPLEASGDEMIQFNTSVTAISIFA